LKLVTDHINQLLFCLKRNKVFGNNFMACYSVTTCRYVGDEDGLMSVLKFEAEDGKLFQLPYHISAKSISGKFSFSFFLMVDN
jgi:hypothetical protein